MQHATMVNTYHWTRSLYDCYRQSFGVHGVVIDTDDVLRNPSLLVNVTKSVGLEHSKLKFTWTAACSPEEIAAKSADDLQHLELMDTLDRSTGILKEDIRSSTDLDEEKVKWTEEFGDEGAQDLVKWVTAAMDDFKYLESHKFVV